MLHILIVEDDTKLNKLFCTVLSNNGFQTTAAFDGEEALDVLEREYIDLIISDIMMPVMDGYTLAESLRDAKYTIPILLITAKDSFADKARGFNLGVDDYMVKPVDVNEMVLRVKALLRRAKIASDREIICGEAVLNYDSLTVTFGGQSLLLPQKEFYLLYKLTSYPSKIFTRQQLMNEIWGFETESDERTVDVHINRLREKMKDCADLDIVTVRGLGYKVVKSS